MTPPAGTDPYDSNQVHLHDRQWRRLIEATESSAKSLRFIRNVIMVLVALYVLAFLGSLVAVMTG